MIYSLATLLVMRSRSSPSFETILEKDKSWYKDRLFLLLKTNNSFQNLKIIINSSDQQPLARNILYKRRTRLDKTRSVEILRAMYKKHFLLSLLNLSHPMVNNWKSSRQVSNIIIYLIVYHRQALSDIRSKQRCFVRILTVYWKTSFSFHQRCARGEVIWMLSRQAL